MSTLQVLYLIQDSNEWKGKKCIYTNNMTKNLVLIITLQDFDIPNINKSGKMFTYTFKQGFFTMKSNSRLISRHIKQA